MTVLAPFGLLALAGVPVLLGLYFLRRRSGPRVVSATFLWRATDEAVQAGPQLRKLNRELSLFLELVAVVAAAAFLADVRCAGDAGRSEHVVVVLDSSLSMRARQGDTTADARARELIERLFNGPASLVASGERPVLLAGPAAPPEIARAALDAWSPGAAAHPFEASFALAREVAGRGARIHFVTDRLEQLRFPEDLTVHAVGAPADNLAFTSATRDDGKRTQLRLRVANFGADPASPTLELRDESGVVVHTRRLELAPGSASLVQLELDAAGPLEARLPDDALPDDGRVLLAREVPRPLRVRVALDDAAARSAVDRVLAAAPGVRVEEPADLALVSPGKPVTGWTIVIGPVPSDESAWRTHLGPFFADRRRGIFEDVTFDGITWTCGADAPGRPLLTAGARVLVSEEPGPVFHVNVDLARSNLARSAAFPLLLGNVLEARRRALPGFDRRTARLGEEVRFGADPPGPWRLRGPEVDREVPAVGQAFNSLRPGEYVLDGPGEESSRLTVLAIDPAESDLRMLGSGTKDATEGRAADADALPARSPFPLFVLLVALLADYALAAPGLRRNLGGLAP